MYACKAWKSFKDVLKETGGNRNLVPAENVTNLIDCKEIE